jgi:uncharacterized membrane protein YfcA
VPGVVIGSLVLSHVTPGAIKVVTYSLLLPLILLQAAGFRRPVQSERGIGLPFGAGLGILYSLTTISGPPLALLFNNQGFVRQEFRAGLALVRILESMLTAVAYSFLGLYSLESGSLLMLIVPSVVVGIPFGAFVIRRIEAATFRRVCMSFDAWVVGFGLSRTLLELELLPSPNAYLVLVAAVLIDSSLLTLFFRQRGRAPQAVGAANQAPASFH